MKRSARFNFFRGFTLVELLVVISILAILTVVGATVFSNAQQNARVAATKTTLDSVYKQIEQKRISESKVLKDITGTGCTDCSCRNTTPPPAFTRESMGTATCITRLTETYVNRLGMMEIPKDGWGDPIMMDENELEGGSCGNKDYIRSVNTFSGNSFTVPFYTCQN